MRTSTLRAARAPRRVVALVTASRRAWRRPPRSRSTDSGPEPPASARAITSRSAATSGTRPVRRHLQRAVRPDRQRHRLHDRSRLRADPLQGPADRPPARQEAPLPRAVHAGDLHGRDDASRATSCSTGSSSRSACRWSPSSTGRSGGSATSTTSSTQPRGFVGVLLETRMTTFNRRAQLGDGLGVHAGASGPLPAIGVVARGYVHPTVAINFEMSGMRLPERRSASTRRTTWTGICTAR